MSKCNTCDRELSEDNFYIGTGGYTNFKCKDCYKERHINARLDHYIVYYLPEEHYCGFTNNPQYRMTDHKKHGKNIDNWRVLQTCATKTEAAYTEALFQSTLGINGLNYN